MLEKIKSYSVPIAFAILCVAWGTTYLGISQAVKYFAPFMLSGLRHVIAGSIFILFCWLKKDKLPEFSMFKQLTYQGILLIVGGNALVCWAELKIPSGITAVICSLSPMLITLMSLHFFKKFKITPMLILGLVLGWLGIVFIFWKGSTLALDSSTIWSILALILAIFSWSLGSIYLKAKPINLSLFMGMGFQMLIAGIINILISSVLEDNSNLFKVDSHGVFWLFYLVIVGSFLGYGCYLYVLKFYPPARVSIHGYVNTLIAVILGWLIGNEQSNIFTFLGAAVVIFGVFIVNREYSKLQN
jgi:drug/metabolite transporter (DMT)-like permease